MDIIGKQTIQTFPKVAHRRLIWRIENVYQCRNILNSRIDGPRFRDECLLTFPWSLNLGQSKKHQRKGISLFMKWTIEHVETLVNFRVYVRKQTEFKSLLDEKYQKIFRYGTIWESPLLVTNDDFRKELQNEIFCRCIEVIIEFTWNEKVRNQISLNVSSKLEDLKEVGTDLKKFCGNSKFSDIYINCADVEIPAHKAILEIRCHHFDQKIDYYINQNWEGIDRTLVPTTDINVMNAFLMYLYTGDIESLMENGPLPIGIHKCAQRMRKFDLERLTAPLKLDAVSEVRYEQVEFELKIDSDLLKFIQQDGDESPVYQSRNFGSEYMTFLIRVSCSKEDNSEPYVSLFLWLEQLKRGERAYVLFDVLVKNGESDLITKKVAADLPLNSCIGFTKLISVNKLLEKTDSHLICKVYRYLNEVDTLVGIEAKDCKFQFNNTSILSFPVSEFPGACHGWINLSCDLRHLLRLQSYSDCLIVVDDHKLHAHRVVLAARSAYFSTVLNSKEEECRGSSKGMEILVKQDVNIDVTTMKIILEEIYTGSYRIETEQTARNICPLAKFFGLRRLQIKCLKFIESEIEII